MVLKEKSESKNDSDYDSDFNSLSENESECEEPVVKFKFLRKGQGKLASHNHGVTKFAKQRKAKVISEQIAREKAYDDYREI